MDLYDELIHDARLTFPSSMSGRLEAAAIQVRELEEDRDDYQRRLHAANAAYIELSKSERAAAGQVARVRELLGEYASGTRNALSVLMAIELALGGESS